MDIGRIQSAITSGVGVDHATTPQGPKESVASQRELIKAVKALNGTELFGYNSELTFVFDRETHRALVRVVDKRTREIILQIPDEDVLRMAKEQNLG